MMNAAIKLVRILVWCGGCGEQQSPKGHVEVPFVEHSFLTNERTPSAVTSSTGANTQQ
jgi:hypothetical protein